MKNFFFLIQLFKKIFNFQGNFHTFYAQILHQHSLAPSESHNLPPWGYILTYLRDLMRERWHCGPTTLFLAANGAPRSRLESGGGHIVCK